MLVQACFKILQNMIGTTPDGGIGPMTLKAVDEYVAKHGVDGAVRITKKHELL